MKYLKTYEKFDLAKEKVPLEVKADMGLFNQSEMNKKQFDKYKAKLKQIYDTYIEDETPSETGIAKDLYNKLLQAKFIKKANPKTKNQIIWKNPDQIDDASTPSNPLFNSYAQELEQERKAKKSEETLQQKQKEIEDKQTALQQNQGDSQVARKDIETATKDITAVQDNLKKADATAAELKIHAKKELDLKKKELEEAKRRIQQLKQ
jgi:hypothetical protein